MKTAKLIAVAIGSVAALAAVPACYVRTAESAYGYDVAAGWDVVGPGVYVTTWYGGPVYWMDGVYWWPYQGYWYTSRDPRGQWVPSEPRVVPAPVFRPYSEGRSAAAARGGGSYQGYGGARQAPEPRGQAYGRRGERGRGPPASAPPPAPPGRGGRERGD